MKKALFLLVVIFGLGLGLISCTQQPTQLVYPQVINNYYTVNIQPSDIIYVRMHHVVSGETLDRIARMSGTDWPTLLALNPWLKARQVDGKWYVDIYPGDRLNMGGVQFVPIIIGIPEQNKQQTQPAQAQPVVPTTPAEKDGFPVYAWILICLGFATLLILLLCCILNHCNSRNSRQETGLDAAVRAALPQTEIDSRTAWRDIIDRSSKKKGRLASFTLQENLEGTHNLSATFFEKGAGGKKEDQK